MLNQLQVLEPAAPRQRGAQGLLPHTSGFDVASIDLIATFLQGKRSEQTRRAYNTDLRSFFGDSYTAQAVRDFLLWPPPEIAMALQVHKNGMIEAGQSEASINRRLSSVRSLFKFAFRLGAASCDGRNLIEAERVHTYRDTTGISVEQVKKLLAAPARRAKLKSITSDAPLIVLRDTAILTLFCMNALRCNEVRLLDVSDFNLFDKQIQVLGKGRGSQRVPVTLYGPAALSIEIYLRAAGHTEGALFRNLDHNPATKGKRLSNRAIFKLVRGYGAAIGCPELHPHKLRHTAITQSLERNNGNIVATMDLSRHLDPKTVMKYNHNRSDLQGQMTDLLGDLFSSIEKPRRRAK